MLSESHKYPRRNGSEHLRLDSRSPALFDTLQIQTPNKTRPIVEKSQSFFFFCFSNFSSVFARGCPQNIGRRTTSYMYNCPGFSLLQSLLLCGLSFQPIERRFISFRHLLPFFFKNHITQSTTTTDSSHLNNFALYARLRLTNYVLFTSY